MRKHKTHLDQSDFVPRIAAAMEAADAAKKSHHAAALAFLLTELDVAITCCKLCMATLRSPTYPPIDSETQHLERALQGAVRTKVRITLDIAERTLLHDQLRQLQTYITLLAESVPSRRRKRIHECMVRLKA
jgi:phytoene dehydrogenase-like protein